MIKWIKEKIWPGRQLQRDAMAASKERKRSEDCECLSDADWIEDYIRRHRK